MKKITLEKLIYKNYLKTSLVSILFIELLLIIIYFIVNNNMIEKSIDLILKDIKHNTYQLVNEKSKSIDNKLSEIEILAKILQNEQQNFFENPLDYNIKNKPEFKIAENGMYYKNKDNGGSSVVVSNETIISESLKKELINTEVFDLTFKTIVDNDKDIIATYYNSSKNYNRYYPYLNNTFNIFPPDIKMENYNFYYEAKDEFNPLRKPVYTEVYLDPAKQGWLLSIIVPIYNKNKIEGVSGIDITLDEFVSSFLNLELPYNGKSFIINMDGKIVAMPEEIEKILNIKDVKPYTYEINEKINTTIYKSDEYSILEYPDRKIVENFKNIIENKPYQHYINLDGKKYLLFTNKMEKTSWLIITLINEEDVLIDVMDLENYYKKLGFLIICGIFIFYIIFFFFLHYKAKIFVSQINNPLLKIIDLTKDIGSNKEIKTLKSCGIVEIDKVSSNFNSLVSELDVRTNKLIIEETKRIYQEKLANTDSLTGAYNRRYLEEFSIEYLKIVRREQRELSLLMIDIDDFKNINDNFGHEVGDKVIKQLVILSKKVVRENDLIIRFGGDEFLILLPSTNIYNARLVAKKIVEEISIYNSNKDFNFTVSIGISQYKEEDFSIENMIVRADDCLYEAKKMGKNCIF